MICFNRQQRTDRLSQIVDYACAARNTAVQEGYHEAEFDYEFTRRIIMDRADNGYVLDEERRRSVPWFELFVIAGYMVGFAVLGVSCWVLFW